MLKHPRMKQPRKRPSLANHPRRLLSRRNLLCFRLKAASPNGAIGIVLATLGRNDVRWIAAIAINSKAAAGIAKTRARSAA